MHTILFFIKEISKACVEMSRVRTGALIVVAQNDSLADYEATGIEVDGLVSSQLLINIFEKNTPLHDGAVIIRGDRVTSATCYLPLSDSMTISKELGTRHRAAIGMSEVSDALVIVVSEETGYVSIAQGGQLTRNITEKQLRDRLAEPHFVKYQYLEELQNKPIQTAPLCPMPYNSTVPTL